jgi:hypothetical protein
MHPNVDKHVWLLEKTGSLAKFLVFVNDRQVPELWLKRFGKLVSGVAFFFRTDDGKLEVLTKQGTEGRSSSEG